jgi:hypothetical protein
MNRYGSGFAMRASQHALVIGFGPEEGCSMRRLLGGIFVMVRIGSTVTHVVSGCPADSSKTTRRTATSRAASPFPDSSRTDAHPEAGLLSATDHDHPCWPCTPRGTSEPGGNRVATDRVEDSGRAVRSRNPATSASCLLRKLLSPGPLLDRRRTSTAPSAPVDEVVPRAQEKGPRRRTGAPCHFLL